VPRAPGEEKGVGAGLNAKTGRMQRCSRKALKIRGDERNRRSEQKLNGLHVGPMRIPRCRGKSASRKNARGKDVQAHKEEEAKRWQS